MQFKVQRKMKIGTYCSTSLREFNQPSFYCWFVPSRHLQIWFSSIQVIKEVGFIALL